MNEGQEHAGTGTGTETSVAPRGGGTAGARAHLARLWTWRFAIIYLAATSRETQGKSECVFEDETTVHSNESCKIAESLNLLRPAGVREMPVRGNPG